MSNHLKDKDFFGQICWKMPFFFHTPWQPTRKKVKSSTFLVQWIELFTVWQQDDFLTKSFREKIIFWTLHSKGPKSGEKNLLRLHLGFKNTRNIKKNSQKHLKCIFFPLRKTKSLWNAAPTRVKTGGIVAHLSTVPKSLSQKFSKEDGGRGWPSIGRKRKKKRK